MTMRRIQCLDGDGNNVVVIEHGGRSIPTTHLRSDTRESLEGLPTYRLESGSPVNMISDTEFQTLDGRRLKRL